MSASKEIQKLAEAEGLTYVETRLGSNHSLLVFENRDGKRAIIPANKSSRGLSEREFKNDRASLRRFARLQYHGLVLTH